MHALALVGLLVLAHPAASIDAHEPRSLREVPRGAADAAADSLPGIAATCADFRGGEPFTVQGQHVLGNGTIDLGWSPSGALCVGSTVDVSSVVVRDGSGGAVVVWADHRMGHADVYALRLNSNGDVVSGWPHDGVPLCTMPGDQDQVVACSDGSGGVFVAWQDYRAGSQGDLFAQHVEATGTVAWEPDGVAVCSDTLDQGHPAICADGAGGALIVWQDGAGPDAELRSAVISSSGVVATPPSSVAGGFGAQRNPRLAKDQENGAYLAWEDTRDGSIDVRVLRLGLDGAVWPAWPSAGVVVGGGSGDQILPALAVDDSANIIVAWCDRDSGNGDIRAQRLGPAGNRKWGEVGAAVCVSPHDQYAPILSLAAGGGAVVAWEDTRGDRTDIWAQRLSVAGEALWSAGGIALCRMPGDQLDVSLSADTTGGAFALWRDASRPGRASFATRPTYTGPVPLLQHTEVGPGRAQLVYRTQKGDGRSMRFERRLADEKAWATIASVRADAEGMIVAEDRTVAPGARAHYRLAIPQADDFVLLEEVALSIPMPMPLTLRFANTEDGGRTIRVALTLATHDEATIDVIDLQGRRVLRRKYGDLGAGEHDVRIPFRGAAGMYFLRLEQGRESQSTRLAVIR